MLTRTSLPAQGRQSCASFTSLLLAHLLTWSAVLPQLWHAVPSAACVRRKACRQAHLKESDNRRLPTST